jgi:hypothetical protein
MWVRQWELTISVIAQEPLGQSLRFCARCNRLINAQIKVKIIVYCGLLTYLVRGRPEFANEGLWNFKQPREGAKRWRNGQETPNLNLVRGENKVRARNANAAMRTYHVASKATISVSLISVIARDLPSQSLRLCAHCDRLIEAKELRFLTSRLQHCEQ